MDAEPWEALDLDDSDLPSLLRPCKRHRSISPATAATTPLSQSHSSQFREDSHSQQLQPASASGRRSIPGPAGAVQAAMFRKNLDRENLNLSTSGEGNSEDVSGNRNNSGVISTQDYILRAMDDTAEFDDDFTRHPWLSALQFLGAEDGLLRSTPISSIKKCLNDGKVDQVAAVIKSSTPNGHGGLIMLLKDPTGTVGATIHHKVLSESEFGKNLTIGAVLILQKVAVFAPVRSAQYLNIAQKNLVKVFWQNSDSTSNLTSSAYPIQYEDPGIAYSGKDKTTEKMSTIMQDVTMEDVEKKEHTREAENLPNVNIIQKQNLFSGSGQRNRASIDIIGQDHCCNEVPEDISQTNITSDQQESINCSNERAKIGHSEGSTSNGTNHMTTSFTESRCEQIEGDNEVEKQKQPEKLKAATLPEWTDEQLDQLFDDDDLF